MEGLYQPGDPAQWNGRVDGVELSMRRLHQVVECIDLEEASDLSNAVVLLGFCCDEGVLRNKGRVGAKDGPAHFRKVLAGLPMRFSSKIRLLDGGDVYCVGQDMESAQQKLTELVSQIRKRGGFPLLLGGGHEITYPHFKGLDIQGDRVGIINIDAHLDIRPTINNLGNSGTGFYQIAADLEKENRAFHYLVLGIQDISNTQSLLDYAEENGVYLIKADEIHTENKQNIAVAIQDFAKLVDQVYLTIDLDAFAAPYAPGVSAPAFNGIVPDATFQFLFNIISNLPNLVSVDIAELNPLYDIDQRTAKLGSDLIFRLLRKF